MSGMAIKFTSLAQIEANQFIPAEDRFSQQEAEDFGAGVPRLRRCHHPLAHFLQATADAAMATNRSLREARTGKGKAMIHYRIYQLDTADHILAGHSIVCRSDAEALDAASRFAEQAATVEVWEGTRRVGCLSTAAVVRRDRCHISPPATIGSGDISVRSGGCGMGKSGVGTGSGFSPGAGVS